MVNFSFTFKNLFSVLAISVLAQISYAQRATQYDIALKDCSSKNGLQVYNSGCMDGVAPPDLSGKTLKGELLQLKKLKGKVIVLNFWFIACSPCRAEMPSLNKIASNFKDDDVVFISIATDKEADLVKFLGGNRFEFKTIADTASIITQKSYHIRNFPTTIVIDKKGVINLFTQGSKDTETAIDKDLDENLVRSIDQCLGKKYIKNEKFTNTPTFYKF